MIFCLLVLNSEACGKSYLIAGFYVDFWFAVMASSVTAASHDQSNSCGCCHRIYFLNFVVHVMECCCFGSF